MLILGPGVGGRASLFSGGRATLLKDLSRIVRNVCRPRGAGPEPPTFELVTTPNSTQQRAYDLLKAIVV